VSVSSGETRGLGLGLESAVNDVTGENQATGGPFRLARLAGTRTEADAISAIAKTGGGQADLWTDLNANEDNVKSRDLSSYRYLHVATHGLLDADRPQFTGVVLSLPNSPGLVGQFHAGIKLALTAYLPAAIVNSKGVAYAVVLHGLQTVWYVAAGVISMPFLAAGRGSSLRDAVRASSHAADDAEAEPVA